MKVIHSEIFQKYPEISFAFSTKIGLDRPAPYYFNLSLSVGDDEKMQKKTGKLFSKKLD